MAERSVSVAITAQVQGFVAGINTAKANMSSFNAELQKSAAKRQALGELGNTAGKIGLVAAAGLGAAVMASANFDKAMSNVQAATHESTEAMGELRQAALDAGADTVFSASEAASGIEALAKAGVQTADILGGGLAGALDLAAAGELGVQDAAEAAAGAMAQFNLEGSQVPHIADLLAAAAGKAQGEVSDMVMALKQSGTVAAQTGLTLEETTGTLAAFAEQSLLGSDAGTSFKQMLAALTPNGAKAASAMEQYNIEAFDAQGNFVGMTALAGSLREGLSGLTQEQRMATMETIFGSDAVRAASIVYDQGAEGIQSWIEKTNDSGYAAETAAIKLDNLAGDLEAFKGSLETALIGAGDGAQGPLRNLVQGATEVVNAFNKLPPAAKNATTGLLAITAVTGGGFWFGAKVVGGIVDTKNALETLAISSPRTAGALGKLGKAAGVAAAALAALAVVDAIQNNFDSTVPGVNALTQSLLDLSAAGTDAAMADALANLGSLLSVKIERSLAPDDVQTFADSLERLADPNIAQALQDNIAGVIGFGGGSEFEAAQSQIEGLEAALTNIAVSAGPDAAAQALADFADAAGLSESQVETLMGLMPGYEDALAGAGSAAELAAGATDELTGATRAGATAADNYTDAIAKNAEAMQERRDAALAAFDAETAWRQAMKDAKAQADKNNAGIRGNSKAALENRDALSNLAAAWNGLDGSAQDADGAFRRAKQTFIDTAVAMGVPKKAAEELARKLMDIPPRRVTAVVVETDAAMSALQRFEQFKLTDKYVDVYTRTHGHQNVGATGGPVIGPGTGTSDDVPYMLSNGEHILTAREVAAAGGHEAIFRMRRALLGGGETVGRLAAPVRMSGGGVDPGLASLVADLRSALSQLPGAVRAGSAEGSRIGTEGRFRAFDAAPYLTTGGI